MSKSACFTVYDAAVAPSIDLQAFPALSQRSHRYEYVIGGSPVHVPVVVFSVSPTRALPEITGGTFDAGLSSGSATTDVGADVAVVEPPPVVALTR